MSVLGSDWSRLRLCRYVYFACSKGINWKTDITDKPHVEKQIGVQNKKGMMKGWDV